MAIDPELKMLQGRVRSYGEIRFRALKLFASRRIKPKKGERVVVSKGFGTHVNVVHFREGGYDIYDVDEDAYGFKNLRKRSAPEDRERIRAETGSGKEEPK